MIQSPYDPNELQIMPEEENCTRCGLPLDGTHHNCDFRAPRHLGYELTLLQPALKEIAKYLQELEKRVT